MQRIKSVWFEITDVLFLIWSGNRERAFKSEDIGTGFEIYI